jgi:hypothetical protein
MSLLDRVSDGAGRGGAEKIFLRLATESPVLAVARRAGFVPFVTESVYTHQGPVSAEQPGETHSGHNGQRSVLSLRRSSRADAYPLFQLYNVAVPESVRRVEAATFAEWLAAQERRWLTRRSTQLVLERDGRLGAWTRAAADGDIGRFDLLANPRELELLEPILLAALARLSRQGILLALVPEYQEPLSRLLKRLGFERRQQYVVMARTAVIVKAPAWRPTWDRHDIASKMRPSHAWCFDKLSMRSALPLPPGSVYRTLSLSKGTGRIFALCGTDGSERSD